MPACCYKKIVVSSPIFGVAVHLPQSDYECDLLYFVAKNIMHISSLPRDKKTWAKKIVLNKLINSFVCNTGIPHIVSDETLICLGIMNFANLHTF